MLKLTEKFNNQSIKVLKNAIILAGYDKNILKPRHLLAALSKQKECIASNLLKNKKLQTVQKISKNQDKSLRENLNQDIPEPICETKKASIINFSRLMLAKNTQKIVKKMMLIAAKYHHKFIGTEHILAAILEINDAEVGHWLNEMDIDILVLKNKLKAIFETNANFPGFQYYESIEETDSAGAEKNDAITDKKKIKHAYLNAFCQELTSHDFQMNVDPIIGRDKEIKRLIQILCRRNKSNPILVGEAGVGKTAIVEGLAKKIMHKNVPVELINKKILALDINGLIAGTMFRGEFESRLKNIINELLNNGDVIIFIDEIHNIVGAGSASGTMDIANILKPIIAKGNIKLIGATTFSEYKKHIEKDPALERRFQPIIIEEPSISSAIEILNGIKENYENYHNLNIDPEAIEYAVKLSNRYIQDRLLPDKAIDLIDETAARYKLENKKDKITVKIKILEENLLRIAREKEIAVSREKFDLALKYKEDESRINKQIRTLKKALTKAKKLGTIKKEDIYITLSEIVKIPQKNMKKDFDINFLERRIKNRIIAQDEVVAKIIKSLKRGFTGINNPNRPLASFLFLGPSGVGKSEIAKVLSEELFGDIKSLIKIDMSEYAESFNISKILGAPAGYVGYEQGGGLTEKIRKRPYSVILIDEFEKAHRSIYNLLLQILEDGAITDASGQLINFKNAIIIMTSNLGVNEFYKQTTIGFDISKQAEKFDALKGRILKETHNSLPLEFMNRLDDVLIFNPLNQADIKKIVILNLDQLNNRLKDLKLTLNFDNRIISYLAKNSASIKDGARMIRKMIRERVETVIAEGIIDKKVKEGDNINLSVKEGKIEIVKISNS